MAFGTGIGRVYRSTKRARKENKENAYQEFARDLQKKGAERAERLGVLEEKRISEGTDLKSLQREGARQTNTLKGLEIDNYDENLRKSQKLSDTRIDEIKQRMRNATDTAERNNLARMLKAKEDQRKVDADIAKIKQGKIDNLKAFAAVIESKASNRSGKSMWSGDMNIEEYNKQKERSLPAFIREAESMGIDAEHATRIFDLIFDFDAKKDATAVLDSGEVAIPEKRVSDRKRLDKSLTDSISSRGGM